MSPHRAVLPVMVVVLALAGCGQRGVGPADDPTPVDPPTSSATVEPQGAPQPTLPLACDDFFSEAQASALVFNPITLKLGQDSVRWLHEAAGLGAGLFHCIWGGDDNDKTDNGWNRSIELTILPDGAAAFDAGVWQVDDGAIPYPAGSTTSEYRCHPVSTGAYCTGNVLVDGYWATFNVNTWSETGFSQDAMEANVRSIVDRVTSVISSAGAARPAWVIPDHAVTGAICAGQPFFTSDDTSAASVAVRRTTAFGCDYTSTIRVSILPGGGWAAASLQDSGLAMVYNYRPHAATVAGADLALWACADGCYALLSVGGSGVEIYDSQYTLGIGETDFVAELPGIVAAITAAG